MLFTISKCSQKTHRDGIANGKAKSLMAHDLYHNVSVCVSLPFTFHDISAIQSTSHFGGALRGNQGIPALVKTFFCYTFTTVRQAAF